METEYASREATVARVVKIAERVAAPEQIEIVEVELRGAGNGRLLRICIDKPKGVTHADCEFVSKNVGTILDVEDVIPGGHYRLEVSSPGLERPLKRVTDFKRFTGRAVKVLLREPVAGKRRWEGTLAGISRDEITLAPVNGSPVHFPVAAVERAKLKFEW